MAATWRLVQRGLVAFEFSYGSSEHWRVVPTELGRRLAALDGRYPRVWSGASCHLPPDKKSPNYLTYY
jgi:hypothetical protein